MPYNNNYNKNPNNKTGWNRNGDYKQHNNSSTTGDNSQESVSDPYRGFSCEGNLGLLYTRRYYSGINENVLKGRTINVAKPLPNGNVRNIKTDHQTLYYNSRNNNIIKQAACFVAPKLTLGDSSFELTTVYPGLLIGSGILHGTGHKGEAKLGLMFDHTTGLPFLPGSSVKGLLRSLFPLRDVEISKKLEKQGRANLDRALAENNKTLRDNAEKMLYDAKALIKQADEKRAIIVSLLGKEGFTENMVDDLERSVFDGVEINEDDQEVHISSNDVFFDAFPVMAGQHGLLGLDYITPHNAGEFKNPTPIQFMRISPNVTFQFQFQLHHSKSRGKLLCSKVEKKELFKEILTTVGIGAKTNVGYGQFEPVVDKK